MLNISPSAIKEIKRLQHSRQQPDAVLELKVSSGGCSGLFYQLNFIDSCTSSESQNSGDRHFQFEGIQVVVNNQSWQYIENLKIDYAEDLMGGGFRFNNPQTKQVCGCGISFASAS